MTNTSKSDVPSKVGADLERFALSLEYCSNSYMRLVCSAAELEKELFGMLVEWYGITEGWY